MEDISENITRCNLCSHDQFLQARSHIIALNKKAPCFYSKHVALLLVMLLSYVILTTLWCLHLLQKIDNKLSIQ